LSDTTLRHLVLTRLEKDTGPDDEWAALVLAALESPEELDQLLADGNGAARKSTPAKQEGNPKKAPEPPRTAFLLRLTAQGFRGIGPKATLDPTPGPGLTAEFALEGERGACSLARQWADGAEFADASTWAQVHGQPRTVPEALG
jgi:hypothetical protein